MEDKNLKPTEIRTSRVFVLDTNVILHDPNAILSFKGVVVAIPFIVLEELDKFKKENNEKGRNAREAIRLLDDLRKKGHLSEGVKVNSDINTILRVIPNPQKILFSCVTTDIHEVKDNLILQTVHDLMNQGMEVTLVTKDINVRVKADALKIDAEDYTKGKVSYDDYYKGWSRIQMPAVDLKLLSLKDVFSIVDANYEIYSNEFIIAENVDNPNNYRLFRYLGEKKFKEVQNIRLMNTFEAKNVQQLMALDLLMDDNIKLVTLLGPAGTGKTFLALLAGLYKVMHARAYRKLLVARPVIALGADVGYLPGDLQEKLHFWMQPVNDNIEFIYSHLQKTPIHEDEEFDSVRPRKKSKFQDQHHHQDWHVQTHSIVEQLQRKGVLSLEAITYMRGRSIPYQFVLIDEVQNLTPHEVKTIVSRAGEGTKVILAGDPYQIDSPYLDFTSNGLTVTTDRFKSNDIFGGVFLETSERSELAKIAAEIL
ncbi:MAG: PhoH-related ATPase [candidate division TM6 bacterium GW2011_GWF2_37_49]|nr:MAG: PhoH-related ATPase [candidate division TM6 bacterium GW2011_GWF2_37_49]